MDALAILEKLDATERPLLIESLEHEGFLYLKLRRSSDAGAAYGRALGMAQTTFGAENILTCEIILRYSAVLRALGRRDEARMMAGTAKNILGRSKERLTLDIHALLSSQ